MSRASAIKNALILTLPLITSALHNAASARSAATPHTASFELDAMHETVDPFDLNDTSGYIWQGFQHNWNRRAFGLFKTPHRLSQLSSRILNESHYFDRNSLRIDHQARTDMFQSTGVDGDWMRPEIHYGIFRSSELEVRRGTLRVEFTDDLDESLNAKSVIRGKFQFKSRGWLRMSDPATEAILHGFSLKSKCIEPDENSNTCNSNGIWPYLLKVGLSGCSRTQSEPLAAEATFTCGYIIEIGRAWTPRKGGLPPFEIKPLNPRTHFRFDIGVQILSAPDASLKVSRFGYTFSNLNPRSSRKENREIPLSTVGAGQDKYPSAMVGIREFGFMLESKKTGESWSMGRYLSGVGISVTTDAYDPATGEFNFTIKNGVEIPGTVKNANLDVHAELSLLQFGKDQSDKVVNASEQGLICIDSSDQAPWFSRWKKCDRITE